MIVYYAKTIYEYSASLRSVDSFMIQDFFNVLILPTFEIIFAAIFRSQKPCIHKLFLFR